MNDLKLSLDPEDAYSITLYGSATVVALWLASALVGAVDSIPLFPNLMEIVGLGYTCWFSSRYLLFKKNREELAAQIQDLKQRLVGLNDELRDRSSSSKGSLGDPPEDNPLESNTDILNEGNINREKVEQVRASVASGSGDGTYAVASRARVQRAAVLGFLF
ncbi:protein CURVATURE THYLAKOID 1D, chloroplastic-like [Gossypium hirsutum]|uniref:Protein CURVATURE THYLAKOID 1D, chloroplastic-like n=1 Tax=Gossypium hirsutum TaxID=3635 RepID=A0ABM2ZT19_GOSHI|nr:protein CURVATURE THYLAKOID 1D, chloroplastic-like [Gossypium hirsutum]